MSTRNQKLPRRDLLDVIGRRMARLTPDQAVVAWAELARRVEALGEMDLPKFKHLVQAIRSATIAGRQRKAVIGDA